MNTIPRLALLLAFSLLPAVPARAATATPSSEPSPSLVGVGVGLEPLQLGNVTLGLQNAALVTPVALYLPLQVLPALRIEPSLGLFHTSRTRSNGATSSSSATSLGVGALWFFRPIAPTGLYAGGRLGLLFSGRTDVSDAGSVTELSENDLTLAPVLGGEHAFSQRFTLGAELQLPITAYGDQTTKTSAGSAAPNRGLSSFSTNAVLFLRYFF